MYCVAYREHALLPPFFKNKCAFFRFKTGSVYGSCHGPVFKSLTKPNKCHQLAHLMIRTWSGLNDQVMIFPGECAHKYVRFETNRQTDCYKCRNMRQHSGDGSWSSDSNIYFLLVEYSDTIFVKGGITSERYNKLTFKIERSAYVQGRSEGKGKR